MNPVGKAIWYIESHFREEISLEAIADAAGVSRFHLSRAFGQVAGQSVMAYVRARRLSEAARILAAGGRDILGVALDFGYGSHEAFTRAFKDYFSETPERVREMGNSAMLRLQEPLRVDTEAGLLLAPAEIVDQPAFIVAGLLARYSPKNVAGIPLQWQNFVPLIGELHARGVMRCTYGVCFNFADDEFDYLSAVEVASLSGLPAQATGLRIPAHRYARFTHKGHVTSITMMWNTILTHALPQQGLTMADAPDFERYGEAFDPRTGAGEFEIWVPVRRA